MPDLGFRKSKYAADESDAYDTGVLPFLPGVDTPADPVPADKVDCAIEPNHSDCQPVSNPGIGEFKWPNPQKPTGDKLADRALEKLDSGEPEIQELNKGKGEWTSTFYARSLMVPNG